MKIETSNQIVSRTGVLYDSGTMYAPLTLSNATNGSSYITVKYTGNDGRVYYNGRLSDFGTSWTRINVTMRFVSRDDDRTDLTLEVSNTTNVFTNMPSRTDYHAVGQLQSSFSSCYCTISTSIPYFTIHLGSYGYSATAYVQKIWLS